MTLDDWLRSRGINKYAYLGNPVAELRKDEAADESLKFLRNANSEELAVWLRNLQQPDGSITPMTKEQLLAIADRPMFDIGRFIGHVAPAILPHDVGQVIADGYKKDIDDNHAHDSRWLHAAQMYGDLMASNPGSERAQRFHKDLIGIHPAMTGMLFSSNPQNFTDPEAKALVDHAIENPRAPFSRDIIDAANTLMAQRKDDKPDWAPDVLAAQALQGRDIFWSGGNAEQREEAAKRFSDSFARGFKSMKEKNPEYTESRIEAGVSHLIDGFGGSGVEHFMANHLTPDQVARIGDRLRYDQREAARPAQIKMFEKYINETKAGVSPVTQMTPSNLRHQVLKYSQDPEQVDRIIENSPNPLSDLQVFATHSKIPKAADKALEHLKSYSKEKQFDDADYQTLMNIGDLLAKRGMHGKMKELVDEGGQNHEILNSAFAIPALDRIDATAPTYQKEREIANEMWSKAFTGHHIPEWISDVDNHLGDIEGKKFAHLDPHVFARAVRMMGHSVPERMLEGLPDEHLHALHNQIYDVSPNLYGDSYRNMQEAVANEVEKRKPAQEFTFTPNSNRLRLIREHIAQQPDRRAHKKALEQLGHNVQSLGLNPLLDAKGNLTHDVLDQHINSLPKRTLEAKIKTWGDAERDPHSIMEQRHSDEVSKVFAVGLPKAYAAEMSEKDPAAFQHFTHVANQSSEGGHPTLPERGIGWVRYTEGPDGVHIDEIQSDFGQNLRAKAQQKYDPGKLADFERAYQQVWQGQKPHDVLHEAFLEHLRQQGKTGQSVHMWTVEPKMNLAGQKVSRDPPVHMRETYKVMPAKAGYKPSTYGKIQTQNHPDLQGQETWEQKLAKFEKTLDSWFADRLAKGWRSQVLGAVAASGLAFAGQQPKAAEPPAQTTESQGALTDQHFGGATGANQQTLVAKIAKPVAKWTPEGLPEEMLPIAHLESSFGRNLDHAKHPAGDFQTAFGALGLKPMTAHFEYSKRPSLKAMHPGLEDQHRFTEELKSNPRFYNQVASAHFSWLKSALGGDPAKAAYGWRWGVGAAQQASPEQIEADPYVQRYRQMRDQQLQTKMHAMFDASLQKSVLPTTPVRMHEGKLQAQIGPDWETVAEKADGGWKLHSNTKRGMKLLARCLLDGEEIDG